MNKKIIFITILGFLLFWAIPVSAQGLVVDFETMPLFDKANFLPGESVTRYINVTNNSGETKKIGVEIIDRFSCSENCLSDVLDLIISKNGSPLQLGTLTTFYGAGEQVLSDLNTGATARYNFSITFNSSAGNKYKNADTSFDIKIGFFGEESISQEITPGGGGGGGSFIASGLIISNETVPSVGIDTVTITWDTNLYSTSRMIYSPEGFPHLLQINNPPNYGYVFSTDEDSNKVINHSVTITGLLPGTTYYYRCISHTSPDTVSQEYSFTTLTQGEVKGETIEKEGEEVGKEEIGEGVGVEEPSVAEAMESKEEEGEEEEIIILPGKEKEGKMSFLAAVGGLVTFGTNSVWMGILVVIVILAILIYLAYYFIQKSRKKKIE